MVQSLFFYIPHDFFPLTLHICRKLNLAFHFHINSARKPWYPHFRAALNHSETIEEIEKLLRGKVVKWRGKAGAAVRGENDATDDDRDYGKDGGKDEEDDLGYLSLIR